MRKIGVIALFLLLLVTPLVFAEDQALIDKAYTCLEAKVNKCSAITSPEEQALSILALSYKSDIQSGCKAALIANANTANNQQCWPKAGCKLKETALAVLALNYIGADASKPEKWLLSQNKTPTDINWYLEIDAREATTCTIKYDSNSTANTVSMAGDKKLSLSGSGSCLSLANSNYWLQISQSCLGKTFRVSCNKDFYTAVLYKKTNSDVWYVSSKTQTASADGTTENSVNSLCFKQGTECNYEGSLWAALALQKNNNIDLFLPYLIANAPDNLKYNPYSFLNKISPADEFTATVRASQNPAGFWDLISGYTKYYDTALSVLGLSTDDKAKEWLQSTQAADGCWPTTRDTALVLWAVWPKTPASSGEGASIDYCEDYNKYCMSHTECNGLAGAEVLSNYACKNGVSICCSNPMPGQTCTEKIGVVCESDEDCTGNLISSTDSSRCCVEGDCETQEIPGCEQNQNTCRSSCLSTEEQKTTSGNECNNNDMCCGLKTEKKSYWWIWLLILLIIIIVLAIVFRNRLRLWLFTLKNKFRKGSKGSPVQQTRPPFPPSAMQRGAMPGAMSRPMPRAMPQTAVKPKSRTDTELDETLKKLKDMSK